MSLDPALIPVLAGFALIAMGASRIGEFFARWRLPLITGFLLTGVLAGPSVLGLIPHDAPEHLRFLDQIAQAFIGLAAGGELYLKDLRGHLRSVAWTTAGQVVATLVLGTIGAYFLFAGIPVFANLPSTALLFVGALAGSILIARSPSSAIAIVRELRARGPFTQTALGVTVIIDAVVIVVFSTVAAMAGAALLGHAMGPGFLVSLVLDIVFSVLLGWLLGRLSALLLGSTMSQGATMAVILLLGWGVFHFAEPLHLWTATILPFSVGLEPLLVCLVAGMTVTNFTNQRQRFTAALDDMGPPVYVVFFTLTGASIDLGVLAGTWRIALALTGVRLVSIAIGSGLGGVLGGAPGRHNRLAWAAYITQAGVGLGLAKEVADEFPGWGMDFATILIAVIIINQIIGPPFLKWALRRVGEAHPPSPRPDFDGTQDVLILGLDNQAVALARRLMKHGWNVRLASRRAHRIADEEVAASDLDIRPLESLDLKCLQRLDISGAEAVVLLASDQENLQVAELLYEHVGTGTIVAHMHDRANAGRYRELGVLTADPTEAFTGLIDHMVRSPAASPLLLGEDSDQDLVEMEVRNPALHGVALQDVNLSLETLVLSVVRRGRQIVSHGFTRLEQGDHLLVMGDEKGLEDLRRIVEGDTAYRSET